ncbi:hypothetical protein ZIOFF_058294 [Zingiber officinale]|uniref:Uncharacterized protein n=1 Tax=Zingiber officinale TaxID=94328 RepID=A0A8J5F795_ZINOF|nr:hypothetical protein ZIOFF_058294 [Zingiber officinale]
MSHPQDGDLTLSLKVFTEIAYRSMRQFDMAKPLYQQQSVVAPGSASSFSGVKVELQHLVLAILDEPVVSWVFGDAGFCSTDIKLAILCPPPPILRFPRAARCPPLFLCNFSSGDGFEATLTSGRLVFPFDAATQLCSDSSEENCRRIGEILTQKMSGQNPMLVLRGIKFLSIEKEVAELGNCGFEQLSIEKEMADYFKSGGTQSDEFAIGLNNTFQAIAGHDIGQFPGLESEKQVEPQACTAL